MTHRIPRRTATLVLAAASLGLFASTPEAEAAPNAREIMEKVTVTRKLAGSEAVVKMVIAGDKGAPRERKITIATKLFDGGKTEKRIYQFLSPADVKGTGVLVFDYDTQADDVWIFVPALRKTRRIVSSQRSQAFMGSEFSFGDLNIPALDDFNYTLVKEESFGGENCYVIDLLPKDKAVADGEGYSKKTYWVSKEKFVVRRGLYYDKDSKLLKELLCNDIKLLDDKNKRYRPMKMEMINKQNGRKSTFESEKIAFSPDVKDEYFTTRYLERT
jgi:outer membrane lipoprotein-sorting protein